MKLVSVQLFKSTILPEQAESSLGGAYVRTVALRDNSWNSGVAISQDGSVMAITNDGSHKISVYSLRDGALLAEFGGIGSEDGQFSCPKKMYMNPRNNNLLIADGSNMRAGERESANLSFVRVPVPIHRATGK